MNIIDAIINLFPAKKIRYQNQFDKVVNLTTPQGNQSTLSGGGTATDQNPTGSGGQQGQSVGVDGLTAIQRQKVIALKRYNDALAEWKNALADFKIKWDAGVETKAKMLTLQANCRKLKVAVQLALKQIEQYNEYVALKTNFEATPEIIGTYKVKTVV